MSAQEIIERIKETIVFPTHSEFDRMPRVPLIGGSAIGESSDKIE